MATLVTWSIYPLTNLYNRSALTEFVAAMLFTIAFASLLLFAWHLHRNQFSLYDFVVAGLFSTLAAAAHSLTALAGGFFFAFTVVGIFFMLPRARYVWFVLVNTLLAILVLSPWIYAVLLFRSRMPITDPVANARNFRYVGWPYDAFTNFLTRTSPFPIEFRALMDGTKIPTPHQDAQILMPLLVLVAFLYVFRSRISWQGLRAHVTSLPVFFPVTSENRFLQVLMYLFLLLFSAFFIICIYPVASVVFGGLFDIMQFSYRMITYVNLSLIAMAFALLAWFHANGGLDERRTQILTYVMVGCLSVSGVSLYEKLVHAEAMIYARYLQGVADPGNEEYLARIDYISNPGQLPRTYYAQYTYLITDHVQPMPENIDSLTAVTAQVALDPSSFDKTLPLQVRLDKPSFVITNIAPFPWNQLLINGNPVNPKELYAAPYDNYATYTAFVYGLQLPAGEYTLAYRFEPNSKWVFLQGVSWLVLLAWAGVYLWVVVRKCRVGHPLFAAPPPRLGRG
ncbi:hypothetical protein DB346_12250 [Verrucomicrobia bacterium LW23]|nr:hypothetical protein DB346_12250 [Verrucomicrobia bacterium LW23]